MQAGSVSFLLIREYDYGAIKLMFMIVRWLSAFTSFSAPVFFVEFKPIVRSRLFFFVFLQRKWTACPTSPRPALTTTTTT